MPKDRSPSRAGDAAERADAALGEIDWHRLPAGASRWSFAAPSGSLAAFSLGDPAHPRVVLVPGATGSKEDFILLAPVLAEAGYYVQAFDLAGQYESAAAGPATGGHYDYPLFADDLVAFLRAGDPAHLLGYSFAGLVAQLVATEHPELCLSLTLLTCPPLSGQVFRAMRWVGWLAPLIPARAGASLMIWGIVTNKNGVGPARLAFVRQRFASTRRSSVDDIVGLMMRAPDRRAAVRAAPFPVLVAVGGNDLWTSRRHARFASAIGARIVVYRTGHSPCETAPHQVGRDMLALFERAQGCG